MSFSRRTRNDRTVIDIMLLSIFLRPYGLGEVEEVSQQVMSYFSEYGFGVYLDAFDYVVFVPYSHYLSFFGSGGDLKTGWQRLRFDNQGMITCCREGILYAFIDSFAIVIDERCLAVNRHRGSSYNAAIDVADALVPKADTEDGDFAAEIEYYVVGNAGLQRGTWARRNDYMTGSQLFDFR
jgi:hypothetical protein